MSRRKTAAGGGAPRTPLGTISKSSNIAPGALGSPGVPQSRDAAPPASPGWNLTNGGSTGLSDSLVSQHVTYIVDTLSREPTDEDVHRQLRSAIKARHENEVLRDHIENLKNAEIDQGLAASQRLKEMSHEYVSRVDGLARNVKAQQARAEAAEQEARTLAEVLRANGVEVPTPSALVSTPMAGPDADVSIADSGVSATPAAALFASPKVLDFDVRTVLGDINDKEHDDLRAPARRDDASFDFGAGAASFDTGSDGWPSVSDSGSDSLGSDTLRAGANEVVHSVTDVDIHEITPLAASNGGTRVRAAATPSRDAAEAAAREAMATLDHPALVDEASSLVATNVRLERERRTLIGRLEQLMRTRPTTPSADGRQRTSSLSPRPAPSFDVTNAVRAAAQLSEAVDRVAVASQRTVMLLDASAFPVSPDSSGGSGGSTPPGTSTPGRTLHKALRRMKAHGHNVGGAVSAEDRRREAREAADEASQAASLASMQRDLLVEALEAAAPSRRLALTPPPSLKTQSVSPREKKQLPLDVISTPPPHCEATAFQVATARAEAAEQVVVSLRRYISAAASKENEDRVESQYHAAQSSREITRLGAELAAATAAAQTAQDIATRRQTQSASLEAKHTRLSIELSGAMQRLRETEIEARALEKRASLSFQINTPAPNAVVSQSPLVMIGTPENLAPILTHVKPEGNEWKKDSSPIASLVAQVSATREGLAAALAAADAAAKEGDAADSTAALLFDLRAQLDTANARADVAEARVGSPPSPSPSPIARKRDSIDDAALDEAADTLGMNDAEWLTGNLEISEALHLAKKNEGVAREEAATAVASLAVLKNELVLARDEVTQSIAEQERLGVELERSQSEEARVSLLLEQAHQALNEAEENVSATTETTTKHLSSELEKATARAHEAEQNLEMAKRAAKEWKAQQTAAVSKWMEEVNARATNAERALAEVKASTPQNRTTEQIVAENLELIAELERHATETETLEMRVATLSERAEAAEKSSADAPHLRAENYDLAVKHRAGLRRLHQELTARRTLDERVLGYEHATAALEVTVKQLEVALSEAMEMCAGAKSASIAAASERAAAEARSNASVAAGTPTSSQNSMDGSCTSPDDRAAVAARETLVSAVQTAELDAARAREETARAKASAARFELESRNALTVAEARRADLAVLRDEVSKLRWQILEMEEDARVSPSPRHGGPPPRALPSGSPFSSIKTFGAFAAEDDSLVDGFIDPDETMALTPPVEGRGGLRQGMGRILNLTPPGTHAPDATRAAAEEVSAAEEVRAANELLEQRLTEARLETKRFAADLSVARAEAEASCARAEAAEAHAKEISNKMDEKTRFAAEASANLELATFAKACAETAARAREDDALEAKAVVKALRAGQRALDHAAAESCAARAAAECAAAEARNEASEARFEAMREAAAAAAAHEARRRAEALAARFAKQEAAEAAEAAATCPKPPPLTFRVERNAAAALSSPGAESAAAAALAAMAATAVPGSPLLATGDCGSALRVAETLRAYTSKLRADVATAQREIASHRERAQRMKAEIDRLASDLPSARKGAATEIYAKDVSSVVSPNPVDPTKAAYYKTVAKKCYARMKRQKSAYEMQISGLRQQIELTSLPSLNTTNNSFAAVTPTPATRRTPGFVFEKDLHEANE